MHHDHLGGCLGVLEMLKNTSKQPGPNTIPVYKFPHEDDTKHGLEPHRITPLSDNQLLTPAPGLTLRVLHTPGHTPDSLCLYLEEEGALFSGDTILGGSSGLFSSYSSYISSLLRLKELGVGRVYPGHGVVEGADVVDRYISHRQRREHAVLACLREFGVKEGVSLEEGVSVEEGVSLEEEVSVEEGVSVEELTDKVYEKDNLQDKVLIESATQIVRLVLEKLVFDGTARVNKSGRWVATF